MKDSFKIALSVSAMITLAMLLFFPASPAHSEEWMYEEKNMYEEMVENCVEIRFDIDRFEELLTLAYDFNLLTDEEMMINLEILTIHEEIYQENCYFMNEDMETRL